MIGMDDEQAGVAIRVVIAAPFREIVGIHERTAEHADVLDVCGVVSTPASIVEQARVLRPDVLILSEDLGVGAEEMAARLADAGLATRLVMLVRDRESVPRGAATALRLDASAGELRTAVVMAGNRVRSETAPPAHTREPGGAAAPHWFWETGETRLPAQAAVTAIPEEPPRPAAGAPAAISPEASAWPPPWLRIDADAADAQPPSRWAQAPAAGAATAVRQPSPAARPDSASPAPVPGITLQVPAVPAAEAPAAPSSPPAAAPEPRRRGFGWHRRQGAAPSAPDSESSLSGIAFPVANAAPPPATATPAAAQLPSSTTRPTQVVPAAPAAGPTEGMAASRGPAHDTSPSPAAAPAPAQPVPLAAAAPAPAASPAQAPAPVAPVAAPAPAAIPARAPTLPAPAAAPAPAPLASPSPAPAAPAKPAPPSRPAAPAPAPEAAAEVPEEPIAEQPRVRTRRPGRTRADTILVFSGKGGVGKSVVATNLAVALSARGSKVALVDLNLQYGDIAMLLHVENHPSSIEFLAQQGEQIDRDYLDEVMATGPEEVRILLAPASPEFADLVTATTLRAVLRELSRTYDHIVVDSPAHLEERVLEVMESADQILVLSSFNITSVKDTRVTLRLLQSLGIQSDRVAVVLNQTQAKVGFSREEIERSMRHQVLAQLPYDPRVDDTIDNGTPIVLAQPRSDFSKQFKVILDFIAPEEDEEGEGRGDGTRQRASRRRLFGR